MTLETVYRTCPTCEASCGLKLEVDRDKGEVISVKGDPDDKRSAGYVCAKSQAFVHIHRDPERLRQPVRRTAAGAWEEISWDEALEEVGNRLRGIREEYGKDSIAFYYGNPNGHNVHTQLYTRLFITMMNSERFFSAGSVDQQPRNLACEIMYGNPWMFQVPDLARTDFLVCMGGNPLVSQGSILGAPDAKGRFEALQERGGKIIVLDPRRSETATAADEHLFIRPGTDAFLLLAWVHELFARDKVTLGHLEGLVDGVDENSDNWHKAGQRKRWPGLPVLKRHRFAAWYMSSVRRKTRCSTAVSACAPRNSAPSPVGWRRLSISSPAAWMCRAVPCSGGRPPDRTSPSQRNRCNTVAGIRGPGASPNT